MGIATNGSVGSTWPRQLATVKFPDGIDRPIGKIDALVLIAAEDDMRAQRVAAARRVFFVNDPERVFEEEAREIPLGDVLNYLKRPRGMVVAAIECILAGSPDLT